MHCKQGGDEETPPNRSGGSPQEPKQQKSINCVQRGVYEMMSSRIHAKELAIRHVGDPRKGMPVGLVECGKRPNQVSETQASVNVDVPDHILPIIKAEEFMMENGAVQC
jgi:hypothetical protein